MASHAPVQEDVFGMIDAIEKSVLAVPQQGPSQTQQAWLSPTYRATQVAMGNAYASRVAAK